MSNAARPRATLSEVAERAGVSKATASKVLNGRPGVAEETRRLVREAIAELGYMPTTGPREVPGPQLIQVVFDTLLGMYPAYVLDGIISGAEELGVQVIVSSLERDGSSNIERFGVARVKEITGRGATGLIVVTAELTAEEMAACDEAGLPLVVIDPANPLDERATSLGATNWAAGVQATRHLLELGHRRIGFAGGPSQSVPARERLHGYREALESAGIEVDPELMGSGAFTAQTGVLLAAAMLDLDDPPTAIFAASDSIAVGVIRTARQRGLKIPADLSVVGFDDTYSAMWLEPPLTTVRQPLRQMGRVAARTVLDLAAGKVPDSHHVQLATSLVMRESTAPPPR
jgi:LacI family transcriptional regulator